MEMSDLYYIHDHLESALRLVDKQKGTRVYALLWAAHDRLERVVISEQARQRKV